MPTPAVIQVTEFPLAALFAMCVLALTAAVYDCRFRKIPNWLNLSGLILGFGLNTYAHGWHGCVNAAEGMALASIIYLPLYMLRGMGAGDVKLMAAIGALAGPGNWFIIFVATSLAGGVAAAAFALVKRRFAETSWNLFFLIKDLLHFRAPYRSNPALDFRHSASLRMPHGLLIAVGCASALSWSILKA